MKKQGSVIISKLLIFCMLVSLIAGTQLGIQSAEAATAMDWNPGYNASNTTIPNGWSSNDWTNAAFTMGTFGNLEGASWAPYSAARIFFNDYVWEGDMEYIWTTLQINKSGNVGTSAYLYMYFNDPNNYYAVVIEPTTVKIVKVVYGIEYVLGTATAELMKTLSLRVKRVGGIFTLYSDVAGAVSPAAAVLTTTVPDTDNPHGAIGLGFQAAGGYGAGVRVIGNASLISEQPTQTPGPLRDARLYAKNYINATGATTLPKGWGGNDFVIDTPVGWGAFKGMNYAGPNNFARLLYNGYEWQGAIDITWMQMNPYGGNGYFYLYYTDANNYLAFVITATRNYIVKRVGGVNTELAVTTSDTKFETQKDVSIRIVKDAAGTISIYKGASGQIPALSAPTMVTTSPVTDDLKGKIGVAFEQGGGHLCGIQVLGTAKSLPVAGPTPTLSPTATPAGSLPPTITYNDSFNGSYSIPGEPKYLPWTGTGFEVETWSNYKFNKANGEYLLGGQIWNGNMDFRSMQVMMNNSSVVYFYFMYQDPQNHYVARLKNTGGGVDFVKVVNGTETVLAHSDFSYFGVQRAFRVIRQSNGRFTLWTGANNTTAATLLCEATDTTFTSGQFGMGYKNHSAGNEWIVQPIIKGDTVAGEPLYPVVALSTATPSGSAVAYDTTDSAVVRYLGRAHTLSSATNIAYPLSGIEFNVVNTKDVYLNMKGTGMIGVFVDDSLDYTRYNLANFASGSFGKIASFGQAGNHKIRVIKLSGWDNNTVVISGLKVEGDTPKVFPTTKRARQIEVIGDSITVGASMFASDSVVKNIGSEGWLSYAGQTAAYLGADMCVAAMGGSGLVRPEGEWMNTFKGYQYAQMNDTSDIYKWNFSLFTPDLIVMNLGTNGGSSNTKEKYIEFHNQVRSYYGDTDNSIPILMAYGPMEQSAWPILHSAYTELKAAGSNVYELSLGQNFIAGGGSHPIVPQQLITSKILVEYIQKTVMPQWNDEVLSAGAYSVSGQTITMPFSVLNRQTSGATKVVAGVYNQDGTLVGMSAKTVALATQTAVINDSITISSSESLGDGKHVVKLFLWDSNNTLKPLAVNDIIPIR